MFIIAGILSGLVLVASLVPFCRSEHWQVRGFDFPRLQFAVLAGALVVFDLLVLDLSQTKSWVAVAAAFLGFVIQVSWILPYTPLWPKVLPTAGDRPESETIILLAANVLQTNRCSDDFLQLVREAQPDVLVALETDEWWQSRLDRLQTEDGYQYSVKRPLDNLYGMLVYSRLPLENAKVQYLVEEGVPSIHVLARLRSGRSIRIHFLHPAPPSPTENEKSGERDAELLMVGKSVQKTSLPVIVAGDLNDVAWSTTTRLFRKASGLLDPRIGRGMLNTFHAERWYMRWPLDHLFCSSHFHLASIRRLSAFGSDHFPVLVSLVHQGAEDCEVETLQTEGEDEQWIEEKIEGEAVSPTDVHQPERRAKKETKG